MHLRYGSCTVLRTAYRNIMRSTLCCKIATFTISWCTRAELITHPPPKKKVIIITMKIQLYLFTIICKLKFMQIYPMFNNNPCFGIYQNSHSMAPNQKIKETFNLLLKIKPSFTFNLTETTIIFMRNTKVFNSKSLTTILQFTSVWILWAELPAKVAKTEFNKSFR